MKICIWNKYDLHVLFFYARKMTIRISMLTWQMFNRLSNLTTSQQSSNQYSKKRKEVYQATFDTIMLNNCMLYESVLNVPKTSYMLLSGISVPVFQKLKAIKVHI